MTDVNLEEVETDVGPLLVHADDAVITPIIRARGTWEEELGDQLRSLLRPGMTAVDVGGNIGYVALLMAAAVGPSGRVVAVEPDPRNAHVLRLNAERTRTARGSRSSKQPPGRSRASSTSACTTPTAATTGSGSRAPGARPCPSKRCGWTTCCRRGST